MHERTNYQLNVDKPSDRDGMAYFQGLLLAFDLDIEPARLFNLCVSEGDGVDGRVRLECFRCIGGGNMDKGAAELYGADNGGVFKGLTGGGECGEQNGQDDAGTRHGWIK